MAIRHTAPKPMRAEEIKKHPEYPYVVWDLKPDEKGRVAVGEARGGPFDIVYELHGHGPRKIVAIMGLGGLKTAWQRQTKDFGHTQADKYSMLTLDNRGAGESDKPFMRYSTSEMAKDIIEVLDHIGWTNARQLNVLGISMGGMIAQELSSKAERTYTTDAASRQGLLIPQRIATLFLLSTACQIVNQLPVLENLRNRINLFLPKPLDGQIENAKRNLFSVEYLESEDTAEHTIEPFPTSGDRFAAVELQKRSNPEYFTRLGFIAQAIAAGWHYKSPEQLRELAGKIGRDRIMVMHGSNDRMIAFHHAETLVHSLDAGVPDSEEKVKREFVEGQGHCIPMEKRDWFNNLFADFIEGARKLT